MAEEALQLMRQNDEHNCFGDYVASELRSLAPHRAKILKRQILRTLIDFSEENEVCKIYSQEMDGFHFYIVIFNIIFSLYLGSII